MIHKRPYRNLKIEPCEALYNVAPYGILLTQVTRLTYSYFYVNKMKTKNGKSSEQLKKIVTHDRSLS